jgi:hypothetical protein
LRYRDFKEKIIWMGMGMKLTGTRAGDLVAILAQIGTTSVGWAAQAQPVTGLYLGAGAGVNFQENRGIQLVNGVSFNNNISMPSQIRPAQAAAAELVKESVPRNVIAIQGFGETHLLVPTGPGVREPQNRRVEIIIR